MTEQPMQGGYRRPENPAPVSGPGSLSRRTDGQGAMYMSGGEYGEGQEMMDLQNSAPMSKTETVRPRSARPRAARSGGVDAGLTSLFAPSERPDEPVTAGMPFGPGENPRQERQVRGLTATLERLLPYDRDGSIERLFLMAQRRGW
jgi:hypothetical protein